MKVVIKRKYGSGQVNAESNTGIPEKKNSNTNGTSNNNEIMQELEHKGQQMVTDIKARNYIYKANITTDKMLPDSHQAYCLRKMRQNSTTYQP